VARKIPSASGWTSQVLGRERAAPDEDSQDLTVPGIEAEGHVRGILSLNDLLRHTGAATPEVRSSSSPWRVFATIDTPSSHRDRPAGMCVAESIKGGFYEHCEMGSVS
jgi:hypothetical protein